MVIDTLPVFLQRIAALLAGALLVTAFAPLGWWIFAFISPAVLVFLWLDAAPRQAALNGYFYGLGLFGLGVSWVYNSIHEFGHAPALFAAALTLLFVLTISCYPALAGWLQAPRQRLNRRLGVRLLLVMPAAWTLGEWLRGWLLTGFPWLQLGYSQIDTLFAWPAPVTGVLGVSWLVMLLVGAGYVVWLGRFRARSVAVLVAAAVVLVCLQSARIDWTRAQGQPLDVALIQGNIAQEDKWQPDWLIPTVERYIDLTKQNLTADLVVWPEVALPGEYALFKETVLEPLRSFLISRHTDLVFGVLRRSDRGMHNALVKLGEDTETYYKRHLVPFGEFIPLRREAAWLGDMVELPAADLTPGWQANTLTVKGFQAGGSICYEDAYGAEVAEMLPKANLLINVSNDAWFGDSFAPHQHLEIARMRALETGRPLLRTTNTGITATIDYRGRIRKRAPQFEVHVLRDTIQPRAGATPYVHWRNRFIVALMLILLALGLALSRAPKKAPPRHSGRTPETSAK